jgi:ABC-type branched-subunit amino acid transport system substrate-binding protein
MAVRAIVAFCTVSRMTIAADAGAGVFDNRIVFGQSAAFNGPAAALGLRMREGILASFKEANAAGGVGGRRLELVPYDDGYEPEKAIANAKHLIDEDGVFALVGEVGTPTSNVNPAFCQHFICGWKRARKALGESGKGVVVTQIVPSPGNTSIPLVARYPQALKEANPEAPIDFVSLEGYMGGRLIIEALGKMKDPVTRAELLTTIKEVGTFDLGDMAPIITKAWIRYPSLSSRRMAASGQAIGWSDSVAKGSDRIFVNQRAPDPANCVLQ